MSYTIQITGNQPNGGRRELHQVKLALGEFLSNLTAQGHQFDSQTINGDTVNLHTDEGRAEAVQAHDDYQDVLNDAVREARRTSTTTALEANDIAGDDPGPENRGAPAPTAFEKGGAGFGNPPEEEGSGTLASQMEAHPNQPGTPSGRPSGASNTQGNSNLTETPKAGEVSSKSSTPGTPTVTDKK